MNCCPIKKLLQYADEYIKESDWKDLALIKFCLFSIGLLCGMAVKKKKPIIAIALIVFLITYVLLMTKFLGIVFHSEKTE